MSDNRASIPTAHDQIWREPAAESLDLYPGLVVYDDRVTGSITLGESRLPLWCFSRVDFEAWDDYSSDQASPGAPHYGVTQDHLREFLHDLWEMRGEFARLLLVLANGERLERVDRATWPKPWWERKRHRQTVIRQLRLCLASLEALDG